MCVCFAQCGAETGWCHGRYCRFFYPVYLKYSIYSNTMLKRHMSLCAILNACPMWCTRTIIWGPCVLIKAGRCVTSPNYPEKYGDTEDCVISGVPTVHLVVLAFQTERYHDNMTINGETFSGGTGPEGVVATDGVIRWSSDEMMSGSGWELCWDIRPSTPPPSRLPPVPAPLPPVPVPLPPVPAPLPPLLALSPPPLLALSPPPSPPQPKPSRCA